MVRTAKSAPYLGNVGSRCFVGHRQADASEAGNLRLCSYLARDQPSLSPKSVSRWNSRVLPQLLQIAGAKVRIGPRLAPSSIDAVTPFSSPSPDGTNQVLLPQASHGLSAPFRSIAVTMVWRVVIVSPRWLR